MNFWNSFRRETVMLKSKLIVTGLLVVCSQRLPPGAGRAASAMPSTPIDALVSYQAQGRETPTPIPQALIDAADAEYLLLENIYDRVTPSVVYIDVTIHSRRRASPIRRAAPASFTTIRGTSSPTRTSSTARATFW